MKVSQPTLSVSGVVSGWRGIGKDPAKPFAYSLTVAGLGGSVDFQIRSDDPRLVRLRADLGQGVNVEAEGFYTVEGDYTRVSLEKYTVVPAVPASSAKAA